MTKAPRHTERPADTTPPEDAMSTDSMRPSRPESREERRTRRLATAWYGEPDLDAAFIDYLEGLDRRREAAHRLLPLCPDDAHAHTLGCFDPLLGDAS